MTPANALPKFHAAAALPRPERPDRLNRAEFDKLSKTRQKKWLDERTEWNQTRWPTILTPQFAETFERLNDDFESRPREIGSGCGFIIDGDSGIGKTTLVDAWAKQTHRKLFDPVQADAEQYRIHIPVVSVSLPETPTSKVILNRILDFIGHPLAGTGSVEKLRTATVDSLRACRTEVLILDEVQHIEFSGRKRTPAALGCLKDLLNEADIFMVLAGSNMADTQLLSAATQVGASPLAARFGYEEITQIPSPTSGTNSWAAVVKAVEANVMLRDFDYELHRHSADYLWNRCHGRLRTLVHLLRIANLKAIRSGDETITSDFLDTIKTDSLTQSAA